MIKEVAQKLNYDGVQFPVEENNLKKFEVKNNICINLFGYEHKLALAITVSDETFPDSMDILLLIDNDSQ